MAKAKGIKAQDIIKLALYGDNLTLGQIGDKVGCSRENVRQILRSEGIDYRSQAWRKAHPQWYCVDCGKRLGSGSTRCRPCEMQHRRHKELCGNGHRYSEVGFYLGWRTRRGKRHRVRICKVCRADTSRKSNAKHKAQNTATQRRYRETHREEIRAQKREYYQRKKEAA